MLFITETTSRSDLLNAIYSDLDLIDAFIQADLDPEVMETDVVRDFIVDWVADGDETE